MFSEKNTTYIIQATKATSARVVFWKELWIDHSYTLEISYSGYSKGEYKGNHHNADGIKRISNGILKSIDRLR